MLDADDAEARLGPDAQRPRTHYETLRIVPMRKMIGALAAFVSVLSVLGCASSAVRGDHPTAAAPAVVFVSGANATQAQFATIKEAFPGAHILIPETYFPLGTGANTVVRQLRDKGITGRLILVGHSWGGLLARSVDAAHPGLVAAVITIATPNGNFRFVPDYVADLVLKPSDEKSRTPLFVIAGVKTGADRRWWMQTDDSDGVVDVGSATTMGRREVRASVIVEGEHNELLQNPRVISQLKAWLQPEGHLARTDFLARHAPASPQPVELFVLSRVSP